MRQEYPRPNFVRTEWMNLNGEWDFSYGNKQCKIQVPFVCQSQLSGIGERIKEDRIVYERYFNVPEEWKEKQVLINFGAVDYSCRVYINNRFAGSHQGGHSSFSFNITEYLTWQDEIIRVEVEDPLSDESIARGKQFWKPTSEFIWYTPSSGIWQTVWLEPVEEECFSWVHFTPNIDEGTVQIDYKIEGNVLHDAQLMLDISLAGQNVFAGQMQCYKGRNSITIDIYRKKALEGSFHFTGNYWSPENPMLYDVEMVLLKNGAKGDKVSSYFGMRKIHIENGKIYLNNRPYYQKLILDQGYWPESLITAPTDEAFKEDIIKAKSMGFNGCRKHEKVEDPRFLYWADKLGFLVWEGMASCWVYSPQSAVTFMKEWCDVIQRDYNHPCIVVWGMLNESWGVPRIYDNKEQQSFANGLYQLAHGLDGTRLVISNDGWEMTQTDICAIHSYKHGEKEDQKQQQIFAQSLKEIDKFANIMEKLPYAKGYRYESQPVVLTEFGGISISNPNNQEADWGYTSIDQEGFLEEYERIIDAVYDSDLICGYCYTQLTDIEQEVNGLLTYKHEYKFRPEIIKKINDKKGVN